MTRRADGNAAPQDRPGRDAEGRRDHGRHRRRPGAHRRGRGRGGGDGARARAGRHPPDGGVARMADPSIDRGRSWRAVSIPVMAKCRIGHFAEARVLEALGVDFIDESEVLTPADEAHHVGQARLHGPLRVRLPRPRRGAAPHRRGRGAAAHQGRGGHRQRRRGGAPPARGHLRHPPARHARPGGADGGGQGARRAVRAGARGGRRGPPARAELRRRRHRHARRRGAADGAGRGGGVRGLRRSSSPPIRRARARAIVRATTHYAGRRGGGRRLARPGRGRCPARRPRTCPPASGCRSAAGDERPPSASSPCRATSPRTRASLRGLGAAVREVRRCADLDGLARPGPARRREHDAAAA